MEGRNPKANEFYGSVVNRNQNVYPDPTIPYPAFVFTLIPHAAKPMWGS